MPTFNSDQLFEIAERILRSAGASAEEAEIVAGDLRDANLVGHDSHGVMRLRQYVEHIDDGYIKPGAAFEVVREGPAFLSVDGHSNFGQVTATKALSLGMEKAHTAGTATVMLCNCNHVGRLGSYAQKAALEGFASVMAVAAPGPGGVAPYGGTERRLGTNPIAMAAPWRDDALLLDMTTSASAEGKLRVAYQKGEPIPEGWLMDAEGNPTTDPGVFYREPGGALLPLGGPLAFKGFGMSVMVSVFGAILSGSGVCRTDLPRSANGVWMYLLDVAQFLPVDEYEALLEEFVAYLKSSRKVPGVTEILMPGEIERQREQARLASGVTIPEETWRQTLELAARLGVSLDDF